MTAPAVLFDLDGTLLDSIALILASYHHTLARFGVPQPADAEIIALLGMPLEACFAKWASETRPVEALVETYREHNLAVHDAMVRPYPGVSELVHALRTDGRKLAVVTSKRRKETMRGLAILGLDGVFETLVCSGDTPRGKPDPAPVLLALTQLGVSAGDAVFVGDSTHDIHAGRAAGVETIGVLWGPFPRADLEAAAPTALVSDAAALGALLGVR